MSTTDRLARRRFLRGTGATLALPFLTAMTSARNADAAETPTPRFVAICGGLGFHAPLLFPNTPGKNYETTPYLDTLKDHRDRYTLLSGLSHPEQNGNNGHASSLTWLTSARRPGLAGFKNSVSIDQVMAEHVSGQTRLPYLCLENSGGSLSWTSNGVNIPSEGSPSRLFKKLFIDGTPQEVQTQLADLRRGKSILDTVATDAKRLNRSLGSSDQQKLDEYFTSVRDLEKKIGQSEEWTTRPKPAVDIKQPQDVADKTDVVARQRLMYEMIVLALQTDSTRVVTLSLGGMNAVPSNIPGVESDWHNLSHHGKDESKIDELRLIEQAEFVEFARFLTNLRAIDDNGSNLLDETAVLFGSNLGNASAHDWHNLPVIVAGGGFRHGSYAAHDAKNNTPLSNLFVTLGQHMGLEIDQFGSSTAAGVRGLET